VKALREAKACLVGADVASVAGLRLKTALAALVEAVEAAPVGYVEEEMTGLVVYATSSHKKGQRVRVLAVGEQP